MAFPNLYIKQFRDPFLVPLAFSSTLRIYLQPQATIPNCGYDIMCCWIHYASKHYVRFPHSYRCIVACANLGTGTGHRTMTLAAPLLLNSGPVRYETMLHRCGTSPVGSGGVPTCDSVHSQRFYSDASLGHQAPAPWTAIPLSLISLTLSQPILSLSYYCRVPG